MSTTKAKASIDGLRLYRVELTQTIYVLAKDEFQAESNANYYAQDDMGDPDAIAVEIDSADHIDEDTLESVPHWDRHRQDAPTVAECIEIIAARSAT